MNVDTSYKDFVEIVKDLTKGMGTDGFFTVIREVAGLPSDKLSDPNFISTVKDLTKGMRADGFATVLKALGDVPSDKLSDPNFMSAVKDLTQGMDAEEFSTVLKAFVGVPSDKLSDPNFMSTVKDLTKGIYGYQSARVMEILKGLDPQKLEQFKVTAQGVMRQGMSKDSRFWVIKCLAEVPEDKRDRVYSQMKRLTPAMSSIIDPENDSNKLRIIRILENFNTEDKAIAYTSTLINALNKEGQSLSCNEFYEKIMDAKTYVDNASDDQIQELVLQSQPTQEKEVDQSLAVSFKGLQINQHPRSADDDVGVPPKRSRRLGYGQGPKEDN